ncbi:MAG: hypothetical protein FWG28_00525 [Clostridiales bacterium]|nr:hypothetical protein [Clostridiales bacterium]
MKGAAKAKDFFLGIFSKEKTEILESSPQARAAEARKLMIFGVVTLLLVLTIIFGSVMLWGNSGDPDEPKGTETSAITRYDSDIGQKKTAVWRSFFCPMFISTEINRTSACPPAPMTDKRSGK